MVVVVAMLACGTSLARECSPAEAQKAHYVAPGLRTWTALYSAFRKYSHCDDGAIAGGFSESVSILVADHWGTLPKGAALMAADPLFKAFVLRHLSEETPTDRWEKILQNARSQCPNHEERLCRELTQR